MKKFDTTKDRDRLRKDVKSGVDFEDLHSDINNIIEKNVIMSHTSQGVDQKVKYNFDRVGILFLDEEEPQELNNNEEKMNEIIAYKDKITEVTRAFKNEKTDAYRKSFLAHSTSTKNDKNP